MNIFSIIYTENCHSTVVLKEKKMKELINTEQKTNVSAQLYEV